MLYIVCEGSNGADLAKVVQRFLDDGWKLQGGVATSVNHYQLPPRNDVWAYTEQLYQAMTKD